MYFLIFFNTGFFHSFHLSIFSILDFLTFSEYFFIFFDFNTSLIFQFEFRAPMQEPMAKRYSDSMLSEPFSTKVASYVRDAKASNLWLIAPLVAILIIAIIVGMLVIW